jgi:GNAT superfamily N-acetyltransferase
MTLDVAFRTSFLDEEVRALHAEAFGSEGNDTSWLARVHAHSLGWVTARSDGVLVGFVNVAWDGGDHAFLVDTMVASAKRRQGIGRLLVERAVAEARGAGCRYLHVDFEPGLAPFYFDACGFRATSAGLLAP